MKISDLIETLYSVDEEELYVNIDGVLYEIEIEHHEETFDGFDTVEPSCISIKARRTGRDD